MKLSDLKNTDVVLSTKGSYGIVLKNTPQGDLIKWFLNKDGEVIHKYRSFSMINEDLTFKYDGKDNRIIRVYRVTDPHDMTTLAATSNKYLIWEEKVVELTFEDIAKSIDMLEKAIGAKVKIVNK